MIKIFITNLAKYTRGNLSGEWVTLPINSDKLESIKNRILGNDEELFITDYTAPFEISEYANIEELNENMQELEELNLDKEEFSALCKCSSSCDYHEILQKIVDHDYIIIEVTKDIKYMDESDIARELYDEGFLNHFLKEIPEHLTDLIDWEQVWTECNVAYGWQSVFFEESGRQFAVNI